jgi:hypothetical protein
MDGGTRFRYELDVAYHAHYYEVEDGEPVSCARIQVSTIIDEANLVVTLVDQTAPSCPASSGLHSHSASSYSANVPVLFRDSEGPAKVRCEGAAQPARQHPAVRQRGPQRELSPDGGARRLPGGDGHDHPTRRNDCCYGRDPP